MPLDSNMEEPLDLEPLFPDRAAGENLAVQLARRLREAIDAGALPAGARLLGTRQLAKRQLTWFRREQGIRWLSGFGDEPAVQAEAMDWLRSAGLG